MQIVIDIPQEIYDSTLNNTFHEIYNPYRLVDAIAKGVVLPKHHGRLIDGDKLEKKFKEYCDVRLPSIECIVKMTKVERAEVRILGQTISEISNAPTVLEATKEGEK